MSDELQEQLQEQLIGNKHYVPLNKLILDKKKDWTFTQITNMSFEEIAARGIVMWCINNMKSDWTMLGGNKFGFEDELDALSFKLQFGL